VDTSLEETQESRYSFIFKLPEEYKARQRREDEKLQKLEREGKKKAREYWKRTWKGKASRRYYRRASRDQQRRIRKDIEERRGRIEEVRKVEKAKCCRKKTERRKHANSLGGSHATPARGVFAKTAQYDQKNADSENDID
ncbi:hypothetical protein VKT23_005902, partial [Stygiomarasmius scandens]